MSAQKSPPLSKGSSITIIFGMVFAIGLADWLTGFEMTFSVFYLLAITMAAWRVGKHFAILISALSIIASGAADWYAGAKYSTRWVPVWNAAITMGFYMVVVWLLSWLKAAHGGLEARVRERTLALTEEIAERERLENEILAISEREQLRFGYDLHDGLCQHLTGTALAGLNVEQTLADMGLSEQAAQVRRIIDLVEQAISDAHDMARGLAPVPFEPHGLMEAFEALAATTRKNFKVDCQFICFTPTLVENAGTAMHLYRIAQEAISNAIRHGKAEQVAIRLSSEDNEVVLLVVDNGCGLPSTASNGNGMGLRIMKHRTSMIGGTFSARRLPEGGTEIRCAANVVPFPHPELA
jgi:signal transduction histidine kinase